MKKFKNAVALLSCLFIAFTFAPLTACKEENGREPAEPEKQYTPITEDDFLTAQGKYIYNAKGEKVVLKGVNLGGWLHMEGWMDGGGSDETYGVDGGHFVNHYAVITALDERFTYEQRESLLETYQNNYVKKSDLQFLKSLGLNYVRVPFFWTEILNFDGSVKENAFDQLDWVISECKALGMYVLLDLHGSVGGHSGGWLTGGHWQSNKLWTDESCRLKTDDLWRAVAGRYKSEPTVLGYDLLNEPMAPVAPAELSEYNTNSLYDRYYHVVRGVDDKHIIVPEAFVGFDDLKTPAENGWENVVYEVHFYDADNKENSDAQQGFINWIVSHLIEKRDAYNVPVLFGEYNFWSAEDAWRTCMSSLIANGISWSSWTYKNTSTHKPDNWGYFYNPTVEQVDYVNDSFDTIAEKWAAYSTDNYEMNVSLTSIVKDCASDELPESFGEEISSSAMEADAYRTNGGDSVLNLLDGDLTTRWSNGEPQNSSGTQYLTVDFGEVIKLNGIIVFSPNSDLSKKFEVYYRRGNEVWKKLTTVNGVVGKTVIPISSVEAGSVKIVNKSDTEYNYWSIYELRFFKSK